MQYTNEFKSPLSTQDPSVLVLFDEDGFIHNADLWNKALAEQLAANAGIDELSNAHWEIIDFLRDRYIRLGAIPPMARVCREFGHKRDAVRRLFGGCLQLWQISGLPYPGEEAKTYMD